MLVQKRLISLVSSVSLGLSAAAIPLLPVCGKAHARTGTATKSIWSSPRRIAQPAFREHLFKGKVSAQDTQAERLLLSGKYEDAQDQFSKAANRNPRDAAAINGLGLSLAMQFKLDAADDQFTKALRLNAGDPMSHVGKAYVNLFRLQSSSMTVIKQRQGILNQAEAECNLALKSDPSMPEALTALGQVQKEQGRLDEASQSFSKAIQQDPRYGMALTYRGMVELQKGDIAGAMTDFKQAVSLRSSNSTAHYGLGKAYLAQNQLDAAIKELNTSLYQFRNSAPTHIALGDCYRLQGNTVAAVKEYQQAISIKSPRMKTLICV